MGTPKDLRTVEEHPTLSSKYSQKNELLKTEVRVSSTKIVLWDCSQGHSYLATGQQVLTGKRSCEYCFGKKAPPGKSLLERAPEVALLYSDKNPKPSYLLPYSNGGVHWWKDSLGHEWRASIKGVESGRNSCPYCDDRVLLSGFNDLFSRHPTFVQEGWDWERNSKAGFHPINFTRLSKEKVWVKCSHCGSSSFLILANAIKRFSTKCRYCSNKTLLVGVNDLETLRPEILSYYSSNNSLPPSQIKASSSDKMLFLCKDCGEEFLAGVANYCRPSTTGLCPSCLNNGSSIGERELIDWVKSQVKNEVIVHDRSLLQGRELDIFIPSLKLAFEYNGEHWHSTARMKGDPQFVHSSKVKDAAACGISLSFVWEDDWLKRRGEVEEGIKTLLEGGEKSPLFSRLISHRDLRNS